MHWRAISRALGFYLWLLAIPICIPLGIAIFCEWIVGPDVYPQPPAALAWIVTLIVDVLLGTLLWLIGRGERGQLYRREGLLLVLMVYFFTPIVSALPFFLNGTFHNPVDAYFESVSAYTTTGATISIPKEYHAQTGDEVPIVKTYCSGRNVTYSFYGTIAPVKDREGKVIRSGIEAISPSLVFWRSFMQCLGGGGIVVLFVAILPALGVGGKILYQTEVTGPSKESMFPRIKETASMLWKVYLGLIALETILLMFTNEKVSLFDALTLSFSTLSTGGFTPTSGGVVAYQSQLTLWIILIFMLLGSINFSLYFYCMHGKFIRLKDPELLTFILIVIGTCLIATWSLVGKPVDYLTSNFVGNDRFTFFQALTFGSFQMISAQTSTGFACSNFNLWPFLVQVLMFILFFVGGMAGSTAGGTKVIRQQTFFHVMVNKIEAIFRPDTIRQYRIGASVINQRTATVVLTFLMVVASLSVISTFLLVLDGIDPETALTTVGCMINNVGIAFRMAGPTESFAFLSDISKIFCSVLMIAGRLEFFAVLVAFVPAFWKPV